MDATIIRFKPTKTWDHILAEKEEFERTRIENGENVIVLRQNGWYFYTLGHSAELLHLALRTTLIYYGDTATSDIRVSALDLSLPILCKKGYRVAII